MALYTIPNLSKTPVPSLGEEPKVNKGLLVINLQAPSFQANRTVRK